MRTELFSPDSQAPRMSELLALLKAISYREGDFTLSSGQKATYYLDGRMTTLHPRGALLIGELLYERIAPLDVQAVGGLTLGADPIVTAITVISAQRGNPIAGFLIRKEAKTHGTGRQIEGHLQPGTRVVLVEDVVSTGSSLVKAAKAVHAISPDIEIVQCLTVVDRRSDLSASDVPAPLQALFPVDAFFQRAADIPCCPGL